MISNILLEALWTMNNYQKEKIVSTMEQSSVLFYSSNKEQKREENFKIHYHEYVIFLSCYYL